MDFIGGFSALVQKGYQKGDEILINSIPRALAETDKVCSSVNIGSTKSGINMTAVADMGRVIKETATLSDMGAAKLVVFANAVEDNPFMAGAFHGCLLYTSLPLVVQFVPLWNWQVWQILHLNHLVLTLQSTLFVQLLKV